MIRDYLGGALRLRFAGDDHRRADRGAARGARGGELMLGEIQGWLSACDLVKFAKVSPTAAEARGALETAIRIVDGDAPAPRAGRRRAARGGADADGGAPCLTRKRPVRRAPRRASPTRLIAARVRAAGGGLRCFCCATSRGFRFAHPGVLALIPPAVALVLWVGLARAPARRAPFLLLARRRAGRAAPGARGAPARSADGAAAGGGGAGGGGAGAPAEHARRRRSRARGDRHRHRAGSVGLDAGDRSASRTGSRRPRR